MPNKKLSTVLAVLTMSWLVAAAPAWPQTAPTRISGDVVLLEGPNLEMRSTAGEKLAIRLSDQLRVSARSRGDPGAIKQGAYVGITAAPQPDQTLLASEVQIFPESMRGTGEGHRPMAPEPGRPAASTMTNATVSSVSGGKPGNTMTNATVANAAPGEGALRLTLSYKGGEKTVVVPENATIMVTEIVDRSALVPGVHAVAYVTKQADGTLLSERVSVGKNGYAPPR